MVDCRLIMGISCPEMILGISFIKYGAWFSRIIDLNKSKEINYFLIEFDQRKEVLTDVSSTPASSKYFGEDLTKLNPLTSQTYILPFVLNKSNPQTLC